MNADPARTPYAIGVDIGGTKCAAGLVQVADGRVLARRQQPTRPERGGAAVLDDVIAIARSLQEEGAQIGAPPAATGIAVCELVSPSGKLLSDATIRWSELRVAEKLAAAGLRAVLDADVRAAARAEAHFGAGRDYDSFLYVTVGTGISCCLVLHKTPYAGARGLTGTFASSSGLIPGHGEQLQSGPPLEHFAAGPALAARCAEKRADFRGAAPDVLNLAEGGDAVARLVVESAGRALGAAVAQLVNVLDPEAVVIGGGLGLVEGLYRESVKDALQSHVWSDLHHNVKLVSAHLGNDAGIVGAALATIHSSSPPPPC